jgi:hypothetical protein
LDQSRRRFYIFGFAGFSEAWAVELDGVPRWVHIPAVGPLPPVRNGATIIHDPARDRVVLYGGFPGWGQPAFDDVWTSPMADTLHWTRLTTLTPPRRRHDHVAIYDQIGDRMVVFGGYIDGGELGSPSEVSTLDLAPGGDWHVLVPAAPGLTQRYSAGAAFDPIGPQVVVIGGGDGSVFTSETLNIGLGDSPSWRWDPVLPEPVDSPSAVYDPDRSRMLVFGGTASTGTLQNRMFALDLSNESPSWTRIIPTFSVPVGRRAHGAVWDPIRHRMLLFGGNTGSLMNDLWAFAEDPSPTWTPVATTGTPPPGRERLAFAYDPPRDRLLIYGGQPETNDLWELPLGGANALRWRLLAPGGIPPQAHYGAFLVYDPPRDRMLLLGGYYSGSNPARDPWVLAFDTGDGTWSKLIVPEPRQYGFDLAAWRGGSSHALIYDPYSASNTHESWELELAPTPIWREITVVAPSPPRRDGLVGSYDPIFDRLIVFGGSIFPFGASYPSWFGDSWMLINAPPTSVTNSHPRDPRLVLSAPTPNPTKGRFHVDYTLTSSGPARLEISDIQGRRLVVRELEPRAGQRSAVFDLGHNASSGLYFVSLVEEGLQETRRIILMR